MNHDSQVWPPPAPPVKKSNKTRNIVLGLAAGLAALSIVGVVVAEEHGSSGSTPTATSSTPPSADPTPQESEPEASSETVGQQLADQLIGSTADDGTTVQVATCGSVESQDTSVPVEIPPIADPSGTQETRAICRIQTSDDAWMTVSLEVNYSHNSSYMHWNVV